MPGARSRHTPEETKNPLLFIDKEEKDESPRVLISTAGKRLDGRMWNEIRPVYVQADVVENAAGSAYVEMGKTKAVCSIFGPREVIRKDDQPTEMFTKGQIVCDFRFAPFSQLMRRPAGQDQGEKEMSSLLANALSSSVRREVFPKLVLEVNVVVLEDGGSALVVALLSASAALCTASIEMVDVPTACSVSIAGEQTYLVDPACEEEHGFVDPTGRKFEEGQTVVSSQTVVFLPTLKEIAGMRQVGVISPTQSLACTKFCVEGCLRQHRKMRDFLRQYCDSK